MKAELLVVPGCPNEVAARDLLHEAAAQAGIADLEVRVTVIATEQQAQRRGFVGSPTFVLNGTDPFAVTDAPPGLACRIYLTPHGAAGVPGIAALRAAVVRARTCSTSAGHDR
jgi:glutaredoxin